MARIRALHQRSEQHAQVTSPSRAIWRSQPRAVCSPIFFRPTCWALQASPGDGGGRADAIIYFPDRRLPIDAKFPREQVLALFEGGEESVVDAARVEFVRVMKTEARRIKTYIQPENGTTDIALMYLPSETLYMEAVRNRELADWLNQQHVFPVSPNTLADDTADDCARPQVVRSCQPL